MHQALLKMAAAAPPHEGHFACGLCDARFAQRSHLKTHERRRHTGAQPFRPVAGRRPFECRHCDKVFLLGHHCNHRPFACTLCDKRFVLKGHLQAHKRRAHAAGRGALVVQPEEEAKSPAARADEQAGRASSNSYASREWHFFGRTVVSTTDQSDAGEEDRCGIIQ